MSIYSNDNISKIAKLTTRELPHLAKNAKITVCENIGVYSNKSAENQKVVNAILWCFIENQNGANAIDFIQR